MAHKYIRLTHPLDINNRTVRPGEAVAVAEIGEPSARRLVEIGRAEWTTAAEVEGEES